MQEKYCSTKAEQRRGHRPATTYVRSELRDCEVTATVAPQLSSTHGLGPQLTICEMGKQLQHRSSAVTQMQKERLQHQSSAVSRPQARQLHTCEVKINCSTEAQQMIDCKKRTAAKWEKAAAPLSRDTVQRKNCGTKARQRSGPWP